MVRSMERPPERGATERDLFDGTPKGPGWDVRREASAMKANGSPPFAAGCRRPREAGRITGWTGDSNPMRWLAFPLATRSGPT